MFQLSRRSRPAFTLIELLVVIAIISILAAILFPVFGRARENARRTSCLSNMKQIGIAMNMYTQDYDERLPEPGLGGVFRNSSNTSLGQLYMGILPFHLAIQPYAKNYQLFACPSDTLRLNASVNRTGIVDAFKAANVPGTDALPPYSNTMAFHSEVAKIFPMSYATNYILSNTYKYYKRSNGTEVAADQTQRGRSLAELLEPTNTWIMTEWGANSGNGLAGYYATPGYLNETATDSGRWRGGGRHMEGRNWLFTDGHAKWHKDQPFETNGVATSPDAITAYYNAKQVYTTPQ